jgi:tetratricopeptide (TPR) repeat protein/tRNA A-37 threonylcarbamoyl transferase component Bud32
MNGNDGPQNMIGKSLGHYLIIEEIGAGGMGVVYRARDSRLERDVAIKVLPAGMFAHPEARRRFRNEALALARLNHPNICSVYDFDSEDGADFLVMEYVPGLSLDKRLGEGSLGLDEVQRLGVQLAAGLAAAHEQRIVHRDLKPGNLRLTSDGRLKILDFGLARLFHPDEGGDLTVSLAETSSFSGTVPYMAPEQLRGEALDTRTDIYSAGAVLYEMTTGRRPFPEPQLAKLIEAILQKDPLKPSQINRRVSSALETILLKAMDRQPERRYQSARELEIDLERLGAGQPLGATRGGLLPSRVVAAALGLVLIAGVGMGWYLQHRGRTRQTLTQDSGARAGHGVRVVQRRSVAVLGFKNLTGNPDAAWLSTALSEMLSTELAAGERLRTVSGENVSRMKRDLALTDADSYAKDTLARIRLNLSSDVVVFGTYLLVPDRAGAKIRVDLRVQETATGETLAAVQETGPESDLLEVVARAGAKLRTALGAPQLSTEDTTHVKAALPQSGEAARFYAEGLDKLRKSESVAARDLLQKAVAADPASAEAHVALATAWGQLGYDAKALEEAKMAVELSTHLSREESLSIEGRYWQAAHNWPKAVETYKSLNTFFPDNPEYALQLATAQGFAGHPDQSLATLEQLRQTIPEMKDDARVDLVEASTADHLSDFKREQAASERAVEKAKARGEQLTAARALLLEGWAWHNLGDSAKAVATSEEAKASYEAAGDRLGVARALHNLGIDSIQHGNLDVAEKQFNEALAIRRAIEDNQGINRAVGNLGRIREQRGDLEGARKFYEESLAIARKISDRGSIGNALGNIANIYVAEGHPAEARRYYEQSLALHRETGDKVGIGAALANLGNLASDAGDMASARKLYEESAAKFEEAGQKSGVAQLRVLLGNFSYDQGEYALAKTNFEQALASAKEIGDPATASDAETGLCNVARMEGDWVTARVHAENAVTAARSGGEKKLVAMALLGFSGALLGQGDLKGAEKAANDGLLAARESGDKEMIAMGIYETAETPFYQGDFPAAQNAYEQALALHQETKNSVSIAETQLALAEVALEEQQSARASSLLQQAAPVLHRGKNAHLEARAYLLLGRTALEQKRVPQAQKFFAEATSMASKNVDPDQRLEFAAWSARADAAAGSGAKALKTLQESISEFGSKAGASAQFEGRLALAELTLRFGDASQARAQLEAIEKDAGGKSFSVFARRAAALRNPT